MPDVLERAVLTTSHDFAIKVLDRLQAEGAPVFYRDYVIAMRRHGFSAGRARDVFEELRYRLNGDMTIDFTR